MITSKNFWHWFGWIWLAVGLAFFVIGVLAGLYSMVSDRLAAS